jgi:hypothetical protein
MSDPTPDQPTPHFNEVMEADDVTKTVTGTEAITEPLGASKGMTRVITYEMSSVSVGWKILFALSYQNQPSSKAWGAIATIDYSEEEL